MGKTGGMHICNETIALIQAGDRETMRESGQLAVRTKGGNRSDIEVETTKLNHLFT